MLAGQLGMVMGIAVVMFVRVITFLDMLCKAQACSMQQWIGYSGEVQQVAKCNHSLGHSCQFLCADPDGIMIVSVIFSHVLRMQTGRHEHVACAL